MDTGTGFLLEGLENQGQRLPVRGLDHGIDGGQPDDGLVFEEIDQEGFLGRRGEEPGEPGRLEPPHDEPANEGPSSISPSGHDRRWSSGFPAPGR